MMKEKEFGKDAGIGKSLSTSPVSYLIAIFTPFQIPPISKIEKNRSMEKYIFSIIYFF